LGAATSSRQQLALERVGLQLAQLDEGLLFLQSRFAKVRLGLSA